MRPAMRFRCRSLWELVSGGMTASGCRFTAARRAPASCWASSTDTSASPYGSHPLRESSGRRYGGRAALEAAGVIVTYGARVSDGARRAVCHLRKLARMILLQRDVEVVLVRARRLGRDDQVPPQLPRRENGVPEGVSRVVVYLDRGVLALLGCLLVPAVGLQLIDEVLAR